MPNPSDSALPAPLARSRRAARRLVAAAITTATAVSFAESYRGLFDWFSRHGDPGGWGIAGPLMVDVFVLVGEATLFDMSIPRPDGRAYTRRDRLPAWAITLAGLAVSVAGNIGHAWSSPAPWRATAAIPPVAAAAALAVGLGLVKKAHEPAAARASSRRAGTAPAEHVSRETSTPAARRPAASSRRAGMAPAEHVSRETSTAADVAALDQLRAAAANGDPKPPVRQVARDMLGNVNSQRRAARLIDKAWPPALNGHHR